MLLRLFQNGSAVLVVMEALERELPAKPIAHKRVKKKMQRTQIERRRCRTCGKGTKFERHVTAMGAGDLVMVWMTAGFWLLARHAMTPKFRCSECGSE